MPKDWAGKTVVEVDVRKKYNVSIMGYRTDGRLNLSVSANTMLSSGMTLMVLGRYKDIQKCFRI